LFREAGTVLRADVKHDACTGKSKGHGTVLFSGVTEAERAIGKGASRNDVALECVVHCPLFVDRHV
jgi:hypothetical protein